MHMLRDQGAPPPIEPTGGPHPRKAGKGGAPSMRGPSPIFGAPSPHHMHDPRRIRRLVFTCLSQVSLHFALCTAFLLIMKSSLFE
jgi:hypothetical protein